jgi:tetratricopeptide (TPR) repeat protein
MLKRPNPGVKLTSRARRRWFERAISNARLAAYALPVRRAQTVKIRDAQMGTRSQRAKRSRQEAFADGAGTFEAEAAYADSIVRTAMGDLEGAVAALTRALEFAPGYAPAIFSLGTVEYQRGNLAAGRRLFHSLLACPADTPELCEIIDHAGDFLIERRAYKDGLELLRAAALQFPHVAVFHQGVGCCAGHEGLHQEAIAASRRALEIEPANARFLSDLGWSLLKAGQLSEAQEALSRAVAMDPGDELAKENLRFCMVKLAGVSPTSATPNPALQPTSRGRRRAKSRRSSRAARG